MEEKKDYYDIELDVEDIAEGNATLTELFYLKDLKQRKFFLNDDIYQDSIADIVRHIMQINKEDIGIPVEKRKPIIIYVASNGGEVDAGFELIDVICSSQTPVYTVNMGYQYSMGFLIGLAGHKRYTAKHAKFLMHDGNEWAFGSGQKVQDRIKFSARIEERVKEYVLAHSKITAEEYDSKLRVEWYLFADEAKEKGFTDYIIGVDCGIEAII